MKFSTTPLGAGVPIEKTSYWRSLPRGDAAELVRRTASFRLSQFLHGEQGALMVAAQLVNAVPHTDAKFYAATQTMDEARHVEVFARYIEKLDEIRPIAPSLKGILDQTLQTSDWMKKLVGMQIVVEGLALYAFREMRNLTEEPLLKELLTYVARDESRHHAYGVQYIERCVPCLWARGARGARGLRARVRPQPDRPQRAGLLHDAAADLGGGRRRPGRAVREPARRARGAHARPAAGPAARPGAGLRDPDAAALRAALRARGDALPRLPARQLRRRASPATNVEEFLQHLPELPADTARWVMGEIQ